MTKKPPVPPRLSREEFRALARVKGWQFKMLAERWGVTPEWISNISRDPERDLRYDDALYGLPDLRHLARDLRQRAREVDLAMAERTAHEAAAKPRTASGLRYRGYLVPGAIVTATTQFGTVAEEGERGIVFQVESVGREERYRVIFEHGGSDWLIPSDVDAYLATTGLMAGGWKPLQYRNESIQRKDFEAGSLDFWPAPSGS